MPLEATAKVNRLFRLLHERGRLRTVNGHTSVVDEPPTATLKGRRHEVVAVNKADKTVTLKDSSGRVFDAPVSKVGTEQADSADAPKRVPAAEVARKLKERQASKADAAPPARVVATIGRESMVMRKKDTPEEAAAKVAAAGERAKERRAALSAPKPSFGDAGVQVEADISRATKSPEFKAYVAKNEPGTDFSRLMKDAESSRSGRERLDNLALDFLYGKPKPTKAPELPSHEVDANGSKVWHTTGGKTYGGAKYGKLVGNTLDEAVKAKYGPDATVEQLPNGDHYVSINARIGQRILGTPEQELAARQKSREGAIWTHSEHDPFGRPAHNPAAIAARSAREAKTAAEDRAYIDANLAPAPIEKGTWRSPKGGMITRVEDIDLKKLAMMYRAENANDRGASLGSIQRDASAKTRRAFEMGYRNPRVNLDAGNTAPQEIPLRDIQAAGLFPHRWGDPLTINGQPGATFNRYERQRDGSIKAVVLVKDMETRVDPSRMDLNRSYADSSSPSQNVRKVEPSTPGDAGKAEAVKRFGADAVQSTPTAVPDSPRKVLTTPSDDLDSVLSQATALMEAGDFDGADKLFGQAEAIERKQQAKDAKAAAAKVEREARRDAATNAKWDEVKRRVDAGDDPVTAEAQVFGKSERSIMQRDFAQWARSNGYSGSRDQVIARMHSEFAAEQYLQAELELRSAGAIKPQYSARYSALDLWNVNDATARKIMTEEMASWFDANGGRVTRAMFAESVFTGGLKQATGRQDYLQ